MNVVCHSCNASLDAEGDFGRAERCSRCGRDTRCCKNCVHYDSSRYNECSEPVADRVVDKEKSNFCDYFKPGRQPKATAELSAAEKAKLAAEALFKKR